MAISGEKGVRHFARAGLAKLVDDRARPVSPVSIAEFVRGGSNEQEAAVRQDLGRWLTRIAPRLRSLNRPSTDAAMWIGLPIIILLMLSSTSRGWLVALLGPFGFLIPTLLAAALIAFNWRARSRLYHIHPPTVVAQGLCGQCGYSLRDLLPAEDHCLVCPECGSAWRKERITWPWWSSPRKVERPAARPRPFRFVFYSPENETMDAAQRLVPAITPWAVQHVAEDAQLPAESCWRPIWAELAPIGRVGRAVTSVLIGAGAVSLSVLGAIGVWPLMPMGSIALGLFLSAAGVVLAYAVWCGDLYIVTDDVIRILTSHERCPSCAAKLTRAADHEHVVACAHCGSTWSLPARDSRHK